MATSRGRLALFPIASPFSSSWHFNVHIYWVAKVSNKKLRRLDSYYVEKNQTFLKIPHWNFHEKTENVASIPSKYDLFSRPIFHIRLNSFTKIQCCAWLRQTRFREDPKQQGLCKHRREFHAATKKIYVCCF